jgi:hypothetical protein
MIFIPRIDLKLWTLCTNQVWNLVDPLIGIKPNGSKLPLREKLIWKVMYKCTMQALKSIINIFDFIKNLDKPYVYKRLVEVMLFF